ncbi:MAG: signal recognition particle protein [Firmicutes bacterium]|nr:signal recognition particle protein [Bacillota bacterium]
MGLFSSLSERLSHIFSKLTKRGKLTELEIKEAMREIRIALLEADVNLSVAKQFIRAVSEKAVGVDILESLTPGQQVIKLVNEELISLMGSTHTKLAIAPSPPTVIMMVGLQGAGKTTMCGKLAKMLAKQGKKPMLVACDIYRPAAIKQLQIVGERAGVSVFEKGTQNPVKTAKQALAEAKRLGYDTLIIDTAGRLHINAELMKELKDVKAETKPNEILLTVDAMTGQDAVTVATSFNEQLDISGVILTKLDGDTRGGAALSIRAVTGKPIKFTGIGEKLEDIEAFHPDRMASRLLGMGDVLTLIEKAQDAMDEKELKKLEKKFKEQKFTLEDYLAQFDSLKKMGNVEDLMGMIPGLAKKVGRGKMEIDESRLARMKAIIQSMTPKERKNPETIKASHKKRIANGSGTSIQEINQLLKQFEQTKGLMKQFSGSGKRGRRGLPF